jgi:hypothetical protein
VERGAQGSTAASHSDATAITRHVLPAHAVDACVDVALIRLGWKRSGHSLETGTTPGQGRRRQGSVAISEILAGIANLGRAPRVRSI